MTNRLYNMSLAEELVAQTEKSVQYVTTLRNLTSGTEKAIVNAGTDRAMMNWAHGIIKSEDKQKRRGADEKRQKMSRFADMVKMNIENEILRSIAIQIYGKVILRNPPILNKNKVKMIFKEIRDGLDLIERMILSEVEAERSRREETFNLFITTQNLAPAVAGGEIRLSEAGQGV